MVREDSHPGAGSEKTQRVLALFLAVAVSTDAHLGERVSEACSDTTAIVALT